MRSPWGGRGVTAAAVLVFLAATGWLYPDPRLRAERQYLFVLSIGYGHLIGAAVFGAARTRALVPAGVSPGLFGAFVATSVLTAFSGYVWIASAYPAFYVPLLAVSLWHIVENDRAIARAARAGGSLAPLERGVMAQLGVLATTAALVVTGDALLRPADYGTTLDGTIFASLRGVVRGLLGTELAASERFAFGDFFSAVTLYHLIGFLVFFAERTRAQARRGQPTAALWRRLLWVHLPPIALCAALVAIRDPRAERLRELVFSPGIYLFWSVLHVVQTVLARGVESAPAGAAAAAARRRA
jgi:hypothetical protein